MTLSVRIVQGNWVKSDEDWWEHKPDPGGKEFVVALGEQVRFTEMVEILKEKLSLTSGEDIEVSYQWPHWMLGPDWREAAPVNVVDDEGTNLFMAIRADLHEVYLRVRVISLPTENKSSRNNTAREVASIQGSPGSLLLRAASVVRSPNGYGVRRPTVPYKNQPLAGSGYYRPLSNGGIIWPG